MKKDDRQSQRPGRMPASASTGDRRWLHPLLIALVAIIPYVNGWYGGFVYDDKVLIRDNRLLDTWENLPLLLEPAEYHRLTKEDNYIPVTTLSFFVNRSLSGRDPFGYHVTNTLLHAANAILLYLIVAVAVRRRFAAFLCALLFAAHPIHTESVTWIAGRTDVLSALFFLLALLLYIRSGSSAGRVSRFAYVGSLASFLVSLFAKEMSITLLPVILLYDVCFAARGRWTDLRARLPLYGGYFAVTLLYLGGRIFLYGGGLEAENYPGGSLGAALLTMSRGVVFYLRMLVFPTGLSISHVFPVSVSLFDRSVVGSILLILLLLAAAVVSWRRARTVTFSIGFFFITLLPVCHLIPIPGGVVAERYLYIPSIGFFVLLGYLLDRASERIGRTPVVILPVLILLLYAAGTVRRNRDWQNETALWSRALEIYPGDGEAYLYRGHALREKGDYAASIEDYTRAIAITPRDPEGLLGRGISRAMLGDFDAAIDDFDRAIRLDPASAELYFNRGNAYAQVGRNEEAIADFDRAIEIDPGYGEAHNNRGATLARMGRYREALGSFSRAIELNPGHVNAYRGRSAVYRRLGEDVLARRDEVRALSLGRAEGDGP